jgi:hypothetical protein
MTPWNMTPWNMTPNDNPSPPDTGWYWGELRGALSRHDWERVWELIAAWPGPSPDQDAALQYVVRSALNHNEEALLGTAWLLKHYRATPVPLRHKTGLANLASRPCVGTVRSLREAPARTGRSGVKVAVAGLNLYLRAWLNCPEPGAPLTADLWAEGDDGYDTLVRRNGQTRRYDTLGATQHAGKVRVKGKKEIRRVGELAERFGQEIQALTSGAWRLAWSRDVLERLRREGSEAHPLLLFEDEADNGTRISAEEVHRNWEGDPP